MKGANLKGIFGERCATPERVQKSKPTQSDEMVLSNKDRKMALPAAQRVREFNWDENNISIFGFNVSSCLS